MPINIDEIMRQFKGVADYNENLNALQEEKHAKAVAAEATFLALYPGCTPGSVEYSDLPESIRAEYSKLVRALDEEYKAKIDALEEL